MGFTEAVFIHANIYIAFRLQYTMRLFPGETVAANTNNLVAEYIVLGCHFTSTYTDALTDQQLQCMPPSLEDMHICWTDELNTYFHFCVLAKASVKLVS